MFRNKPNTTNAIEIKSSKGKEILVQVPYPKTRNIVFKGGGILGVGYGGVAWVLEKYGFFDDVVNVAGSSAGAIAALYVGLGYTADEMTEKMSNMDFAKFIGDARAETLLDKAKKIISIIRSPHISLSSGDELLDWLHSTINEKICEIEKKIAAAEGRQYVYRDRGNTTFGELATYIEKAKQYNIPCRLKYLYVAVTVLSAETPDCEICSHLNPLTIDLPIAQAVRASCSFPFLFTTVPIKFNQREDLDQCTDGGVVNNFPIGIFDDTDELPDGIGFTKKGTNPGTLGIRMDSKNQREHLLYNIKKKVSLIYASDFAKQYIYALTQALNISKIRGARNILSIDSGGLSALDTKFDKTKLVESAKKETLDYLRDRIDTLYDYRVYKNVHDWLSAQDIEELEYTQIAYENMLQAETQDWLPGQKWHVNHIVAELERRKNQLMAVDMDQLNDMASYIKQLVKMDHLNEIVSSIKLVKEFSEYTREKMRDDSVECKITFPDHLLNIKPNFTQIKWSVKVKADMESEIDKINKSIEACRNEFNTLKNKLAKASVAGESDLVAYVSYQEKLKVLQVDKVALQVKLGNPLDKEKMHYFEVRQEARLFELFAHEMNPIVKRSFLQEPLNTVLKNIGLHDPVCKYEIHGCGRKVMVNLDLRCSLDRNIYLIAALLYCQSKHYSHSSYQALQDIYEYVQPQLDFECAPAPVPVPGGRAPFTIDSLSTVLKQTGLELNASVYKIGKLLHHFEKVHDHKCNPKLDIDAILKVPQLKDSYLMQEEGFLADTKRSQSYLLSGQGFFKTHKNIVIIKSDHPQKLNVIDRIAGVVTKVGYSVLMTFGMITNRYSKSEAGLIAKTIQKRNHFLHELDKAEHILDGECQSLIRETRLEVVNGWSRAHDRNEHQVFLDYIKVKKLPKDIRDRLDERLENLFQSW